MRRAIFIAGAIALLAWSAAADVKPAPPRPTDADLRRLAEIRTQALHDADACEALPHPTQDAAPCDAFFDAFVQYGTLLNTVFDWCGYLIDRMAAHDPSVRLDAYCLTLNHDPVLERQDRITARIRGQ